MATKFGEISTVDFSYVVTVKEGCNWGHGLSAAILVTVKSMVEILQNFVAFSEYMNFNLKIIKNAIPL